MTALVERIYWHEDSSSVHFASEAKALLRILPQLREFDKIGVAQFLTFGCTLESRTLFRNVNVLPGASLWTFGRGACQRAKYFSPQAWEAQPAAESYSADGVFNSSGRLKVFQKWLNINWEL
jgi:asparagine synthase (glutamine-hydrolysing)